MSKQIRYGLDNPHPFSQMKTELVWEGKYNEYGERRTVEVAGCAMPLQKIETIDEPASRASAKGDLFDGAKAHRDDFRNMLIWGDNKLVMASLLKDFQGKIDLIYIDPPFDVGADFTMDVPIGDEKETAFKDQSTLEMVAYRDMWGRGADSYLQTMHERFALMSELLSDRGSIYIHVAPNISHAIKLLADEVFLQQRFQNEIVWRRNTAHNNPTRYGPIHEVILYYTKTDGSTWNRQYSAYDPSYLEVRPETGGLGHATRSQREEDEVLSTFHLADETWHEKQ